MSSAGLSLPSCELVLQQGSPLKGVKPTDRTDELVHYITALEAGSADARTLQKLALLCFENPIIDPLSSGSNGVSDPVSPSPSVINARAVPPLHKDLWTESKHFDRLFDGLTKFLTPDRVRDFVPFVLTTRLTVTS